MNTRQENIDKLMESFYEFVLDYKGNPKNKDFIHDLLRGEDKIFIYTLFFQKDNDSEEIISLQNYKSYIRQDIDLKYQGMFYDEFQWVMDQNN